MAKDLLDFSKFKKIFEDEKNTHLQHPKGHTIIVAHVALSPKLKKQIADLPMHPEKMVELAHDIMEQMPHRKMAEGGEAKPFKGYNPEKHSRTGGLNDEYREKYNREHGSDLKRPVTGNPKPGTEAAGRKKSFCARMKGVKGPTSEGGELTPKGAALKRWNCHAHGGKVEDTDHDEECMHYAGGGEAKPAVSRLDMNYKDVTRRIPELTAAANRILSGEMAPAEYDALVNKHKPVEAYGFVPKPATREEAIKALGKRAERYGATHLLKAGDPADLRLDIPSYRDHGVWINSIHPEEGSPIYNSVSSVKNAKMVGAPKQAIKVASGIANKSPFAVISGEWNPIKEKEAVAKAQKYLKHPEWRQVGYDPERHGYFYDRETMHPIESAEEVLQIGPLVLAKKPVYGKKHEQLFAEGGDVEMYAKGGATARKAAKEYDWDAPAGSQDLFRETPASMFDPEGRKLTKKAQEEKLFGPTGEPDPDTKQGAIHYANQQKAIARYMESLGVPMVESRGKFQLSDEIIKDIKAANKKRVKAGLAPLPVPNEQEIQESPEYEKSPTSSTLRGAQFYRSLLQKPNPKPDWRSGNLEAQRNIGAKVHELGHIPLLPENIPIGEAQEIMDEGSERVGRLVDPVTGESRQGAAKQIQEEIQPMAAENKFRTAIGIPAYGRPQYNDPAYGVRVTPLEYDTDESGRPVVRGKKYTSGKHKGEYKEVAPPITSGSQPRISLDTQQPYATRLTDEAGELYDLIAQSKNMSPETRQRVLDLIGGITRMREEGGTAYTPAKTMTGDTLVNLRGQGRTQEAEERLRTRGQNRFGRATKFPFAKGGRVMLQAGGPPTKAPVLPKYDDPNLTPWQSPDVAPSPTPEYRGYNSMSGEEQEQEAARVPRTHYAAPLPGMTPETEVPATKPSPAVVVDADQAEQVRQAMQGRTAQDVSSPEESYYDEQATPAGEPAQQWTPVPDDTEALAQARESTARRKVQTFYNQEMIMLHSGEDIGVPARPVDPSLLFGPNGEPPETLDPSVLERAEKRFGTILQRDINKRQMEQTRIQKENIARARMNLPPKPTPGAPAFAPVTGGAVSTGKMSPYEKQLVDEGPAKERLPTDTMGTDLLGPQSRYAEGMAEQIAGTRKMFEAQQKAARDMVKPIDENVLAKQALYQKTLKTQQALEDYHTQITSALMDPKNQIDPMKVWKDKGTLGKISSAIGLLIGGMGGGLLKQENPAYRFLKDQIDASVEAQKANLGRYDNLLKTNVQAMQQTQAGAEMLRAQLGEIVTKQLEAAVKRYEDPRLQGEMEKAIGGIKMGLVTTPLQKAAFMKLAYDPATTEAQITEMMPTIQALFPDLYDEITKRRVPGYGVATIRGLTLDEQNQIKSVNTFIQNANRLERLVNEYRYKIAYSPLPSKDKAQAISIMAGLTNDLAKAHGAEPTEGIMGWLETQLGSPTSIKDAVWTGQKKLGATVEEMKGRKRATLEQAFGRPATDSLMRRDEIRPPEYAPTNTESKEATKRQLLAPPHR